MLTVGVGSYGIASIAGLSLVSMLSIGWIARHGAIIGFAAALSIWAALGLCVALGVDDVLPAYIMSDLLRGTALLFLIYFILQRVQGDAVGQETDHIKLAIMLFSSAVALGYGVLSWTHHPDADTWRLIGLTGISIIGLLLVASLLRASRKRRGVTQPLLIGAGSVHAIDLLVYTSLSFSLLDQKILHSIQPIIVSLAVPLLLVSLRRLPDVMDDRPAFESPRFGMTAVIASGIYLLLIAALGDLVRGLDWLQESIIQLTALCGGAMMLVTLLASTGQRPDSEPPTAHNDAAPLEDDRHEWRRLIERVTETAGTDGQAESSLGQRALQAVAASMDCDGGALFLHNDDGDFSFKTSWNIALANRAPGDPPTDLLTALSPSKPALVFNDPASLPTGSVNPADMMEWLSAIQFPWIILALIARDEIVGLVLLTQPRRRRELTTSEMDVLTMFAHQLGSYLVVEASTRQAAENRYLKHLSRHRACISDGLEDAIAPLSTALKQAKDHGQSPTFFSDTFLTIGDTVERLKGLKQRMDSDFRLTAARPVELRALIEHGLADDRLDQVALPQADVVVAAEPVLLQALLNQIIDNACAAVEAETAQKAADITHCSKAYLIVDRLETNASRVSLTLRTTDHTAVLEIVDRGIGMADGFVNEHLFKPRRSTRSGRIRMDQCQDIVEHWKGQLQVESEPRKGTTVKVIL
ncbi:MAG: GAF domain-containing protein, partial [Pseudomonadota bacterium]